MDLICSIWNLGQGVSQVFQISSHSNPNHSRWNCDRSTPITIWTPSAFTLGGQKTVKLCLLILGGWTLGMGLLQIANGSHQLLLKSKQFQMELWHIYSDSCLDSQCFYVGGGGTDCQGKDLALKLMDHEAGTTQVFQMNSYMVPNSSRGTCKRSTSIPVSTPSDFFCLGRMDCQAVDFDMLSMEADGAGHSRCAKPVPTALHTVPFESGPNLLWLPSGLLVILCLGSVKSHSVLHLQANSETSDTSDIPYLLSFLICSCSNSYLLISFVPFLSTPAYSFLSDPFLLPCNWESCSSISLILSYHVLTWPHVDSIAPPPNSDICFRSASLSLNTSCI